MTDYTYRIITLPDVPSFDLNTIPRNSVFIFDIDETLLEHKGQKAFSMHDDIPNWLSILEKRGYPMCMVTARYTPSTKDARDEFNTFNRLRMYPLTKTTNTRNRFVPMTTYTNAELKGPYVDYIVNKYKWLGYTNFYFFDNLFEQVESVVATVTENNPDVNITGIFINK